MTMAVAMMIELEEDEEEAIIIVRWMGEEGGRWGEVAYRNFKNHFR
jgi:hypothetical protein